MILVTVGTQLGFDRLIEAMDALAPHLGQDVVAQTGKGSFQAQNMDARSTFEPQEFEALVKRCTVMVSHAGIGSVLTAQRLQKPIVLIPRRAQFGEHRNDHQLTTVAQLTGREGIFVAETMADIPAAIRAASGYAPPADGHQSKPGPLHEAVTQFIEQGRL